MDIIYFLLPNAPVKCILYTFTILLYFETFLQFFFGDTGRIFCLYIPHHFYVLQIKLYTTLMYSEYCMQKSGENIDMI
jgi:hypothetical protein